VRQSYRFLFVSRHLGQGKGYQPAGSTVASTAFCKFHQLHLVLHPPVRRRHFHHIQSLRHPCDPIIAANRRQACATASYNVAAVTSTVWVLNGHAVRKSNRHSNIIRFSFAKAAFVGPAISLCKPNTEGKNTPPSNGLLTAAVLTY
jgi:hypothetical protein